MSITFIILNAFLTGAFIGVCIMGMFNGASYNKGYEDGRNEKGLD